MDFGLALTFAIAALVLISIVSSVLSYRLGAPLLLVFLVVGLIAGEDGPGQLHFNDANVAYLIGSLALAVVLFDSGFATSLQSFRIAAGPAVTLATIGVALTATVVGAVAHAVLPLTLPESLLLGAIIASTDAAAVFFLLRAGGIRIQERVRSVLEVESGSNDPMAIFLTLILLGIAQAGTWEGLGATLAIELVQQIGLGFVFGLGGGWALQRLINALNMDSALYPLIALSAALCIFTGTNLLGGSGFLAIYIAGLYAGNRPLKSKGSLRRFQAAATWLAQIMMFLTLGLFATPSQFGDAALPALILAVTLTFLARPLAVAICLAPFRLPAAEVRFVSWVGLRGAVSILLALLPIMAGLTQAHLIFNTVFLMVVFSLLIQGWTIRPVAQLLKQIDFSHGGLVDRLDIELPGDANHELVGYLLNAKSPVLLGTRIPRWARPSLIVRDGHSLRPHQAGEFRPGDLVYLFCAARHIKLLDRIYAGSDAGDEREFLGDFSLAPDTVIDTLAQRYGLPVPPDLAAQTLRETFALRLRGQPELGDRVPLGPYELIVRDLDADGAILEVGLLLDNPDFVGR